MAELMQIRPKLGKRKRKNKYQRGTLDVDITYVTLVLKLKMFSIFQK